MNKTSIFTKIVEMICIIRETYHNTSIDKSKITEETSLCCLGLDSLDVVKLTMDVERAYNIEITDEEANSIFTIKDIIDLVIQKQKK